MRPARISRFIAVFVASAAVIFSISCRRPESLAAGKATVEGLMKLLPAGVQSVGALDVHRAAGTEAVHKMLANERSRSALEKFAKASGIDPLKDVYLVVGGNMTMPAGPESGLKADAAAIINLRHDQARTIAAIKTILPDLAEERYRDVLFLSGFGSIAVKGIEFKPIMAFLDPSNIAIGNEPMVRSIIDVYREQARGLDGKARLYSMMKRLDGSPMARAAVLIPPDLVKKAATAMPQMKVVEGVEGLVLAFDLRDKGAVVQAVASGGTEQQNKDLAGTLTAFKMLGGANMGAPQQPGLAELMNSLTISSGNDFVRIYASIPGEILEKLQGMAAEKMGKFKQGQGQNQAQAPAGEDKKGQKI